MVNIKLKRFSRSKEEQPESPKQIQEEPQPDSPSYSSSENQIKKSRGRPKKKKSEVTQQEIKPIKEQEQLKPEQQPQPQQLETINYDDLLNENFLDDLNNVNYKDQPEIKEIKKPKQEQIKNPFLSLDSKIKKGSQVERTSNFSLDSHSLLDKIKKGKPQTNNNDFDSSMFSANGSEILGRDKRILLTKIRQYKSLFPETFKTFKIKANANVQELQTYLDEMDSIVECDSVEQFLLDSILQRMKLIEGVSSYTKYDVQGLADLLKANKQFHQMSKQLFIKYGVFKAVPIEGQMLMLVATSAYICNSKNRRKGELESY